MFLDNGDGIVFVGEFGPWYSPENTQFQLSEEASHDLLKGTLKTYDDQGGPPLREVFLHCASNVSESEIRGYKRAVPEGVKLVICRIRVELSGPRLFRPGNYPPIQGLVRQNGNIRFAFADNKRVVFILIHRENL